MSADRTARALFAARLHVEKGTLLSDAATLDVAAELLVQAADNERLRELVVMAQDGGAGVSVSQCPWCHARTGLGFFHAEGCLAFDASGEVR